MASIANQLNGCEFPDGSSAGNCVDVLMAAWNREATIARAVKSVLEDPAVRALIVIDDASTDRTFDEAIRAGNGSGRLILRRLERNRGPAEARNFAITLSDAPWIAVVDADDYVMPQRFSRLLAFADGWDFVADDILHIAADRIGVQEPEPMLSQAPFEPWPCDLETFILGNISGPRKLRKDLGFFKPLMSRRFLETHSLRYDESLRLGEDYALYARCLALGARFLVVPAQGYISAGRTDSLSARHSKEDLERLRDSDLELVKMCAFTEEEHRAILKHYHSIDARVQWLNVIEAVKDKSPVRFLEAALRSREVALFVSARLREQLVERSLRKAGVR
jgi:succinoglycan biosynthesis protein ExoU